MLQRKAHVELGVYTEESSDSVCTVWEREAVSEATSLSSLYMKRSSGTLAIWQSNKKSILENAYHTGPIVNYILLAGNTPLNLVLPLGLPYVVS